VCGLGGKPMDAKRSGSFHIQNKVTKEEKQARAEGVKREPAKAKGQGF
jgi:hypothetical protein